jgi:H-type lectin domain
MSSVAPLSLLAAVVPLNSSMEHWTLLEPLCAASKEARRSFHYAVTFERSFSSAPIVHVGLVGLDASKEDNLRLSLRAEQITAAGFELVVETWLHTRLWAVDVSWLAIGH